VPQASSTALEAMLYILSKMTFLTLKKLHLLDSGQEYLLKLIRLPEGTIKKISIINMFMVIVNHDEHHKTYWLDYNLVNIH